MFNWCFSFRWSACAITISLVRFVKKAEVVRTDRGLWNCLETFACCHHVDGFVLFLQRKKYLIIESCVRASALDVRQDAAHCTFPNFNWTNNKGILYAEASLCLQESTLAIVTLNPVFFIPSPPRCLLCNDCYRSSRSPTFFFLF